MATREGAQKDTLPSQLYGNFGGTPTKVAVNSEGKLELNIDLDGTYLRLDTTNDPLTGQLDLATGSTSIAPLKFTSGDLTAVTQTGAMEFNADDYYLTMTSAGSYTGQYPPSHSATYVKATNYINASYAPWLATDPTLSKTGSYTGKQWISTVNNNQRFHIDLGSAKAVTRIYYENGHTSGAFTKSGANEFTFWGSNDSADFNDLTYTNDGTWTQLTTSQQSFDEHITSDVADPKYITVTNETAYRYYAVKIANNHSTAYPNWIMIRHIELQTGGDAGRNPIIVGDGANLTSSYIPAATTNGRLIDTLVKNDTGEFVFDDNVSTYWGTGKDISFDFDATDFNTTGTGDWNITGFTNVGIGTDSPTNTLHIVKNGSTNAEYPLKVEQTGTSKNVAVFWGNRGNASDLFDNTNITIKQNNSTLNDFAFVNFTNAVGYDTANFGVKYLNHTTSPSGDAFISTGDSGLPTVKLWVTSEGNVKLPHDNAKLYFGAGDDVYHQFTGTNYETVGTGDWNISGFDNVNITSSAIPFDLIRNVSNTADIVATQENIAISSGNMVDGFGSAITFEIQDTAGVQNRIGFIGAERNGADNSGKIILSPYTSGSSQGTAEIIDSSGGGGIRLSDGTRAGFEIDNTTASFKNGMLVGSAGNPNFISNWEFLGGTSQQGDASKASYVMNLRSSDDGGISFARIAPAGAYPSTWDFVIGDGGSNVKIPKDNTKLYFGAADDASITYDGTDLCIDSSEVGSGTIDFKGQTASAITTETLSEYITVKINGVSKKLAIVA